MNDALIPERWSRLAEGADHVDARTGQGTVSVLELAAGILSYRPAWMDVLWRMRGWLVRGLGLGRQEVHVLRFTAETLPVKPGVSLGFFEVVDSDGKTFWIVEGRESHLEAILAVFAEPMPGKPGVSRFRVVTVVRYRSRIGPIYFNIIKPFHHLVVKFSMRDALGTGRPQL
ncbi:DUF2867 domain-containing protein [Pseudodesulfovibrio portus]|uniref:DUF2867 domain-containing protein n=1 Tax=Pseudodesulfovibrio portus TaxID=231439 RepID=A0ABN6RT30_9BACT|nr:DUF2867 domain-containing protein [Pseudodesulfovibrio portus]BDQ34249.1 hypothetical protein JCM14722_17910 [Pseudodesulfovibrio portus]